MASPIKFEVLKTSGVRNVMEFARAKVPGGWLIVMVDTGGGLSDSANSIAFMPDPTHCWKGDSL